MIEPAVTLFTASELREGVARLAGELRDRHPDGAVLVAVLKGSLPFLSDLVRLMGDGTAIDFLAISSYAAGTGRVRLVKDLDIDVRDRPVVLVEDIVDTGLTLGYLRGVLQQREPSSLSVCTLFDKVARRILPVAIDHVGFEVADEFLLGYGLDYAGRYRNLPSVAAGDLDVLRLDPDAYVEQLYAPPTL